MAHAGLWWQAFAMHLEDPLDGPRGLTFGLIGGLLSWMMIIAAALLVRRVG
jgi:hypothetical protein